MDESGNERQEWMDGFGNLIEVDEPSTTTGTQGTGMITLYNGQGQNECFDGACTVIYDQGTVSVTVFGNTFSASYNQNDSGASSIADELNASGFVTASVSGNSISLVTIAPGANSQITGSCQSEYPQYFNCLNPSVSGISGGTGGLSSSPFVTNYAYDAGGRLTSVVQGAQTPHICLRWPRPHHLRNQSGKWHGHVLLHIGWHAVQRKFIQCLSAYRCARGSQHIHIRSCQPSHRGSVYDPQRAKHRIDA